MQFVGAALALGLAVLAPATPALAAGEVRLVQGKRVPPVALTLAFRERAPTLGGETALELTARTAADLPRVRIRVRLPAEVRLLLGTLDWEGPLAAGIVHAWTLPVVLLQSGVFDLGASATILEGPYTGQVAGTMLYVSATTTTVEWGPEPP